MRNLASLVCGVVFGLGLALSGMINPAKVVGFLDITGAWDPSLAFVMGGAVAVTAVAFRLILRRPGPVLTSAFHLPSRHDLDRNLISGAVVFGVGWGLAGLCPGPAISSLAFLDTKILIFVAALIAGSFIARIAILPNAGSRPSEETS
jgi:uncharacterized membrane protein YedE/YeeE